MGIKSPPEQPDNFPHLQSQAQTFYHKTFEQSMARMSPVNLWGFELIKKWKSSGGGG